LIESSATQLVLFECFRSACFGIYTWLQEVSNATFKLSQ